MFFKNETILDKKLNELRGEGSLSFNVLETMATYKFKGETVFDKFQRDFTREDTGKRLGTHSKSYQLITNKEFFSYLENQIADIFDLDEIKDVKVNESISKGGAQCFKEYQFPNVSINPKRSLRHIERDNPLVRNKNNISFRIIGKNTFDGSAKATVYVGDIDEYCSNGTIWGNFTTTEEKHIGKFNISNFGKAISESIKVFKISLKKEIETYYDTPISRTDALIFLDTIAGGKRLSKDLAKSFEGEINFRGSNLWALKSTLTHYGTHSKIHPRGASNVQFDDSLAHAASSRIGKQEKVREWLTSETWTNLVERCQVKSGQTTHLPVN